MNNLKIIPIEPSQSVIDTIEVLLEQAKQGSIIGIAYCTIDRGDMSFAGWSGGNYSKYVMLAAMELLKHDYMHAEIERDATT